MVIMEDTYVLGAVTLPKKSDIKERKEIFVRFISDIVDINTLEWVSPTRVKVLSQKGNLHIYRMKFTTLYTVEDLF